jgi:hypothetical protein
MRKGKVAPGDERGFPVPQGIPAAQLLEALEQTACPVCTLRQRGEDAFFFTLLWEGVNDAFLRQTIRESLGFCRHHTHKLRLAVDQPWAGTLGVAILYQDLVNTLLTHLRHVPKPFIGGVSQWARRYAGCRRHVAADLARSEKERNAAILQLWRKD